MVVFPVWDNRVVHTRVQVFLEKVRADVSAGRNVDVYVLAVLAALFSLFSVLGSEPLAGAGFAIASLYCCEVLRARHKEVETNDKMDGLVQKLDRLLAHLEDPELAAEAAKIRAHTRPKSVFPKERRPL